MRGCTAFTLIELLAVVAIAALVVTLASANLSAASCAVHLLKARSGIAQMDARGRLHARTSGESIMLQIDPEAHFVRLMSRISDDILAEFVIPIEIEVTLARSNNVGHVLFDRRGVSEDYQVDLHSEEHSLHLRIAGLTGQITESEAAP